MTGARSECVAGGKRDVADMKKFGGTERWRDGGFYGGDGKTAADFTGAP